MSFALARALVAATFLALAPIAAGAGAGGASTRAAAIVERIVDGDTLVVRGGARIRLVQIDAPEAGTECYSASSTRELVRLAPPGTRIALDADRRLDRVDRYDRLLRYVFAAGKNVNVELVRRGAATPYFYGGDRGRYASALLSATSAARSAGRGMWGACRVTWSAEDPVDTRPR